VAQPVEPETTSAEILRIVRRATGLARKLPEWRTASYEAVAQNQFMTATSNFERAPSILLDLRWRARPALLRIAVGIGEIVVPVTHPLTNLSGPGVELARRAFNELFAESAMAQSGSPPGLPPMAAAEFSAQDPKPQAPAAGSLALTRFCTVSSDFDEIVNALYRPLDALVAVISRKEQRHSGAVTPRRLGAMEIAGAAAAAPALRTRFSQQHAAKDSQIARWGELLSATAGIEQLIAERFYAAFHDYKE